MLLWNFLQLQDPENPAMTRYTLFLRYFVHSVIMFYVYGNFTLVIIALNDTSLYSDLRIIGPGMQLAVEEVRQRYPEFSTFQVEIWREPFLTSCDNLEFNVADTAARMYYEKLQSPFPISVFVGTTCTYSDKQLLDLLYHWNLPLIEGASLAAFIADRTRYPLAMGFSYNQIRAGEFFYKVVRYYKGTHVTGLFDSNDATWRAMYSALDYFRTQDDVSLESIQLLLTNITQSVYEAHLRSRVSIIMANPAVIRRIMVAAYYLGYTGGDHIYIAGSYFKTKFFFGTPQWSLGTSSDMAARSAFQSLFLVKQHISTSAMYREFARTVENISLTEYQKPIPPDDEVNIHAVACHDAILSYAQIVHEALREGQDIFDGRQMTHRFTNRTFSGIRGTFTLDAQNNVPGHFELWSFDQDSGEFVRVIDFPDNAAAIQPVRPVIWASGNGPPLDEPLCWFDGNNPLCLNVNDVSSSVRYWAPVVIGVAGCICFTFVIIYWKTKRRMLRRTLAGWQLHGESFVPGLNNELTLRHQSNKIKVVLVP